MKFDTSGLELGDLAIALGRAYDVAITSVAFVPKGEDAYCYVAATPAGQRLFVRAKPAGRGAEAEEIYEAVAALHGRLGISAVMAPVRTVDGTFSWEYGRHVVTVYPYVEGGSIYESGAAPGQVVVAAGIMAAVHQSDHTLLPALRAERFDNPFDGVIRQALADVASARPSATYQRRVADLLGREQADVIDTLDHMVRMQRAIVRLGPEMVATHGDPNWANFLVDAQGALYLTDWGELAFGPPGRDMTFFTGEHFEVFLPVYLELSGPIRLHRLLFAFYLYRWAVQEIADYTTRILRPETTIDEAAHAWEELQPYLPVPHADIQDGLAAVMETLHRQPATYGLQVDDRDMPT